MRLITFFVITLVLSVSAAVPAKGGTPLPVMSGDSPVCAGPYLEILEDPRGMLSFDDVRSPAYAQRFTPSGREVPNFSFSSSAYWARYSAHFTADSVRDERRWILKYRWPFITSITAYIQDSPGKDFRKNLI